MASQLEHRTKRERSTAVSPEVTEQNSSRHFEPLLDSIEAAKLLRLHPKTLLAKVRKGEIPGVQVGRAWRFRASDLNRWVESLGNEGLAS